MDLKGYEDLDEFASETDDPLVELSQDVYHRMIESFGSNLDVPADASLGLEDVLHGDLEAVQPQIIEAGLRLDPRIDAAKVTITEVGDGASATGAKTVRADVQIVANGKELGIVLESDGTSNAVRVVT